MRACRPNNLPQANARHSSDVFPQIAEQRLSWIKHGSKRCPDNHGAAMASPNELRLRLTVQRHKLPDENILWDVRDSDVSISKLLREVNRTIRLKDAKRALSDYVVEMVDAQGGRFECLHFRAVGKVLREGDSVLWVSGFPGMVWGVTD